MALTVGSELQTYETFSGLRKAQAFSLQKLAGQICIKIPAHYRLQEYWFQQQYAVYRLLS